MSRSGVGQVYVAKGARVFYSSLLSILIPQYVIALGYPGFYLGVVLVSILAGNVVSNLAVTYLESRTNKRVLLLTFGLLIIVSGVILGSLDSIAAIVIGCFLGNISTTGTEAGPFQSMEAGVLPDLAGGGAAAAFGRYNLVGYGASALGALGAGTPGVVPGGLGVYKVLLLGYALVGVLLMLVYSTIRSKRFSEPSDRPSLGRLSAATRRDITILSMLFSIDGFGGSFVSQYVLSAYFLLAYSVHSEALGGIFFVTSLIVTGSMYVAGRIAGRLGNLRTMVYTHLISNGLLIAIPLAGSLTGSLAFLFARQSLSQMDVPTRQALMAEMFGKEELVTAFALSNTARSVSAFAGGPVGTALLAGGLVGNLLLIGGASKIVYDVLVFVVYKDRYH